MDVIKNINAAVAFLTEIGMYIAYGMWGYSIGHTSITRWICALIPPICIAIVWGIFAAPQAGHRIGKPWIYILEVILLIAAAALLYKTGHKSWAITLAVLSIVTQVLAFLFKQ